jgi:hypothetical protein
VVDLDSGLEDPTFPSPITGARSPLLAITSALSGMLSLLTKRNIFTSFLFTVRSM